MEAAKIVNTLNESKEFKEWHAVNKKSYLIHVFKMLDEVNQNVWQVGYYNTNDTITTFFIDGNSIRIVNDSEIFKKDNEKIPELDISKVKIDIEKALDLALDFQKKEFKSEIAMKRILILQHLAIGQVYNITFVTHAFKTLNMKVDAVNGEIKDHKLISLMDFNADGR